eukprot:scaffold875_cov185-Amphora_coffeaeformis.AAC.7
MIPTTQLISHNRRLTEATIPTHTHETERPLLPPPLRNTLRCSPGDYEPLGEARPTTTTLKSTILGRERARKRRIRAKNALPIANDGISFDVNLAAPTTNKNMKSTIDNERLFPCAF